MSVLEVLFQHLVVQVVLWTAAVIPSITNVAFLVLLPAMRVQLVVSVESLPTETTFWMPFEPRLIDRSWIIISKLFMRSKFSECEKLMFMSKDFLVSRTKIAHDFAMFGLDMSMEIWPAETCYITIFVWTVVAEQKYGILEYNFLLVFDTQVLIYLGEFVVLK
jgi:hypothetical protein